VVGQFRNLGVEHFAVLSGDHEQAVAWVGKSVGIDNGFSKLKPDQKADIIREYQERNLPVMFIGDGINDAPALAACHVGVAMGWAGTEVALETADIALTHDDIARLPWLMSLSKRMLKTIKVNIAFGLIFNAAAVVAGGMGWLTPMAAAVVHNAGSVLVGLSSASLAIFPDR
jgi:Cd2+/Zn2+-exporting ATPase